MDMNIFVLAFIAVLYPLLVFAKYWGRITVTHQSTQPGEINFAVQAGQTIVGVMDTTREMCFYIGNDAMESKDYE